LHYVAVKSTFLSALPADVFEAEKQTSSVFQELPWHYLEVAHVLLTSAKECFSSVKEHMEVLLRLAAMHNYCQTLCGAMRHLKLHPSA
jgi:hypothetical protein